MSDLERAGVELYVDGVAAFQQGFDDANTALDGLGSTAVDIDDKLQQLIDIMSESASTSKTELAPAIQDTAEETSKASTTFADLGNAMLGFGAVAIDVGTNALETLTSGINAVGDAVAGALTGGLSFAIEGLVSFAQKVGEGALGAEEGQEAARRLAAQLEGLGDSTDITVGQVEALAEQFAVLAGGSADTVIAIEQIAISSQAVSSQALPAFIQASLDLGAVMGDNEAAATLLARAYAQPSDAIGLLRRQNILLTAEQEAQIAVFEEAGDKASALAIITGALADATGGAALANAQTLSGAWGIFTTVIGEAFETLGAQLLPVMQQLGTFILSTIPIVTALADVMAVAFSGGDVYAGSMAALGMAIGDVFGEDTQNIVMGFINGIVTGFNSILSFVQTNMPAIQATFEMVWSAIGVATAALAEVWNTSLGPALTTLFSAIFGQAPTAQATMTTMLDAISIGAANLAIWVTTVLVPAVEQFSAWIVSDFTPAATSLRDWLQVNIPIAIQAASDFWNNTLMPAVVAIQQFTVNTLIPAIQETVTWLQVNIPPAIDAAATFFNAVLLPALDSIWSFTINTLIPIIQELATNLSVALTEATNAISVVWNTVLLPALTGVQAFIADPLTPLLTTLGEVLGEVARIAGEVLALVFNAVLLPAFTAVNDYVTATLTPVFTALSTMFTSEVGPALGDFKTNILDGMVSAFIGIKDAVDDLIDWLDSLKQALAAIRIPNNLTPGSPTPFEMGLRGISSALSDVTGKMQVLSGVNDAMEPMQMLGGNGARSGGSVGMGRVPMPMVTGGGGVVYNNTVSVQASYARYTSPPSIFADINQGLNQARA